jgi:hypothetical protein
MSTPKTAAQSPPRGSAAQNLCLSGAVVGRAGQASTCSGYAAPTPLLKHLPLHALLKRLQHNLDPAQHSQKPVPNDRGGARSHSIVKVSKCARIVKAEGEKRAY